MNRASPMRTGTESARIRISTKPQVTATLATSLIVLAVLVADQAVLLPARAARPNNADRS
jgi:hypothetical protein